MVGRVRVGINQLHQVNRKRTIYLLPTNDAPALDIEYTFP